MFGSKMRRVLQLGLGLVVRQSKARPRSRTHLHAENKLSITQDMRFWRTFCSSFIKEKESGEVSQTGVSTSKTKTKVWFMSK